MALYLAVASRHVRTDIVSADAFPDFARRYGVRSVPTTIVDDEHAIVGAPAEAELARLMTKNPD